MSSPQNSSPLPQGLNNRTKSYQTGVISSIITALSWAVLALFLKYALLFTDTITLSWFRLAFAALCLQIYFLLRGQNPFPRFSSSKSKLFWAGGLLALNYLGYIKGIEYTNPSHAQIMIQGASLSLFLIGVFYFKERVRRLQWLGFWITIAGFVLFYFDQAPGSGPNFVLGNLWLIIGAISWGVFASIQKGLLEEATPLQVSLMIFLVSSLFLLPFINFGGFAALSTFEWFWLGFCGLNTLISYVALAMALSRIPASVVSPILAVNPLITIGIMFLLHEVSFTVFPPDVIQRVGLLGALFVVTGVTLIVVRLGRPQFRSKI